MDEIIRTINMISRLEEKIQRDIKPKQKDPNARLAQIGEREVELKKTLDIANDQLQKKEEEIEILKAQVQAQKQGVETQHKKALEEKIKVLQLKKYNHVYATNELKFIKDTIELIDELKLRYPESFK